MVFAWFAYFLVGSTYIVTTTMTMDDARDIANSYTELTNETGFDFEALGDLTQETLADIRGNESGIVAFNATAADSNNFVRGLFVYHLFGYLWMAEMIKAIGMLTIAGAIASDYWITSVRNPLCRPTAPLADHAPALRRTTSSRRCRCSARSGARGGTTSARRSTAVPSSPSSASSVTS